MPQENRVVVLIDMDCFYCQVEEKLNPDLKGKPIAVVQYNPWKGGGIIAVNYVARAMGVTRHMRGDEAKEKCPEIELPVVPCQRGKADITKYRDAGKEVAKVLQKYTNLLERASIDEAYLDITEAVKEKMSVTNIDTVTAAMLPNTYTLGYEELNDFITDIRNYGSDCSMDFDYENTKQLLIGALIVSEIRRSVFEETGYQCSAGIAHNKILAKLVCGMNKPNKQTILPKHCIDNLYSTLSLKKVKHLGGKFGDSVCEILKITKMSELKNFSEKELQSRFDEKNGTWLYNIAKGIDLEPVQAKFNPKSIGCCKQFRGKAALIDLDSLKKWLKDLGDEIEDRLEKDALENNRNPKQMVVSFATKVPNDRDMASSRSYNFCAEDLSGDLFSSKSLELIMESTESGKFNEAETNRKLKAPITFLGISVGKFEDNVESKKTRKIKDYFSAGPSSDKVKEIANVHSAIKTSKKNDDKVYILQKFFKHDLSNPQIELRDNESCNNENRDNSIPVTVANCDTDGPLTESKIQSSFFASILKDKAKIENTDKKELNRPTTPNCNIVNCGEDSNDTDCSGSTINMEINRSIALFENDPENVDRMCNIRDLLKHSTEQDNRLTPENEILKYKDESAAAQELETVPCSECGKIININELDLHADYHLALKLKEEDRQQVRRDISNRTHTQTHNKIIDVKPKKKPPDAHLNKMDNVSCITSFLVKVDNNILTEECSECGKKIPVDKFSEHLDFHEAKKLSRELNKTATPSHVASSTLKRKNKSLGSAQKSKVPCKSIDSFFR